MSTMAKAGLVLGMALEAKTCVVRHSLRPSPDVVSAAPAFFEHADADGE